MIGGTPAEGHSGILHLNKVERRLRRWGPPFPLEIVPEKSIKSFKYFHGSTPFKRPLRFKFPPMKNGLLFLLVIAGLFAFLPFFQIAPPLKEKDWTDLNEKLAQELNDSLYSHKKLYKEELMRVANQLHQEPFLSMNQRFSRRILTTKQKPDRKTNGSDRAGSNQQANFKETEQIHYTIERTEYSSGLIDQVKLYGIVEENDDSLEPLCVSIREQYDPKEGLVICLYKNNPTGIALAKGESHSFSEQDIMDAWLVFYSFHPVEGDYFDNKPGQYLAH